MSTVCILKTHAFSSARQSFRPCSLVHICARTRSTALLEVSRISPQWKIVTVRDGSDTVRPRSRSKPFCNQAAASKMTAKSRQQAYRRAQFRHITVCARYPAGLCNNGLARAQVLERKKNLQEKLEGLRTANTERERDLKRKRARTEVPSVDDNESAATQGRPEPRDKGFKLLKGKEAADEHEADIKTEASHRLCIRSSVELFCLSGLCVDRTQPWGGLLRSTAEPTAL